MTSFSLRTLSIAHDWVSQVVREGDRVIDATVGNGHDTFFLAKLVGASGAVYGFDIQQDAINQTQALIQENEKRDHADYQSMVHLHVDCHSKVLNHVAGEVSAVMFNLGYLPSSDKAIITKSETTLVAIKDSLTLLKAKGLLTIVCYPGHTGGESEALEVDQWSKSLDSSHYSVLRVTPHNPRTQAPYLIVIQKGR